jgi:hypothetical protein
MNNMLAALTLIVTMSWSAPAQNTDNSPVSPPLTYTVFQGGRGVVKTAVASKLAALAFTPDLTKGLCFELSTTDKDGDEGPRSPEVCVPSIPLAPGAFKFVITLTP